MRTSVRVQPFRSLLSGLVLLSAAAFGGCSRPVDAQSGASDGAATASASPGAEAKRRVAAGAKLIDVRTPAEFAAGHIEGAVNIPVADFEKRLAEIGDTNTSVVVYCRSGNRTKAAMAALKRAGYKDTFDLGPMSAW